MDLQTYVDEIHSQLTAAADAGGDEARALAERLAPSLDSAIVLALHHALAAAAEEITVELAPGSVELRLRGREPRFVVTPPPADPTGDDIDEDDGADDAWPVSAPGPDDAEQTVARINLRMPDNLKARVERAAEAEGLSINAWLVRAAAARIERTDGGRRRERRAPHGAQRYTGWAR